MSMCKFSVYDPSTGEIKYSIECRDVDVEANTPAGHARIDGLFRGDEHYVENGQVVPLNPVNPVISGLTISALPPKTTARIERVAYQVEDGVLEFSSNLPGPYVVELSAPGYMKTSVTLG